MHLTTGPQIRPLLQHLPPKSRHLKAHWYLKYKGLHHTVTPENLSYSTSAIATPVLGDAWHLMHCTWWLSVALSSLQNKSSITLKNGLWSSCLPPLTIGSSYSNCLCKASGRPFTRAARALPEKLFRKQPNYNLSQETKCRGVECFVPVSQMFYYTDTVLL